MSGWAVEALAASGLLMALVLAVRGPARRWVGPGLAYGLWALPVLRLVMPPLPGDLLGGLPGAAGGGAFSVLAVGAAGAPTTGAAAGPGADWLAVLWLAGAAVLVAVHVGRHWRFRRDLLAGAVARGRVDGVRIVAADVEGPIAFGVVRRVIAVPLDFDARFTPAEQALALAHERAHHRRGDLVANWAALAVLAAHWWNPLAWMAVRAFREDQEFAVDADVLARGGPDVRPDYARVLAKAAGLGGLSICNLNPCSNLKGRLMMMAQQPRGGRRAAMAAALMGAAAFAATVSVAATPANRVGDQAVTIGVKPDGAGHYALIIDGRQVAPGAALPGGAVLPADFEAAGGCDLKPGATPHAMAIKGSGGTRTYTVTCGSAGAAPVRATLDEALASLKTMRASVASQPASAVFPEAERAHALGAIDRSIGDVEAARARG